MLTNARRVASVRSETYCNLFSLSVEHFNMVLDMYPLMRRTMESIAAERLNKIGKNPSIVCPREDFQSELKAVSELLTLSAQSPSDDSESDISLFTKNKTKSSNQLHQCTQLPRPKSESCFPLMSALSINGLDKGDRQSQGSPFQRSESFFRTGARASESQRGNPSTCITVTAPSSTSLNKQ